MATSKVSVTEGAGKNLATHSLTEDAVTKEISRVALNTPAGVDLAFGAGAVNTGTPRVTHASDDPLVAALKAEDAAHSSGDVGFQALAVRHDTKGTGLGADGDYTPLSVNSVGDLRVDVGSVQVVRVAPTVTAGAYTANDCMGGEMTIGNAARVSGGGGVITGITMVAEDDSADGFVASDVEVMIFASNPAGTYTDNIALNSSSLTDDDALLLLGSVLLDTKSALGNVTMLKAINVNLYFVCSGSADLFAVAINRGGKTPEATDAIQFTFHILRS